MFVVLFAPSLLCAVMMAGDTMIIVVVLLIAGVFSGGVC
jgi:hypothetical protein